MDADEILKLILEAARQARLAFGQHAEERLEQDFGWRPEVAIRALLDDSPELIEDYPEDIRGRSCLIRLEVGVEVMHIVVTGRAPVFAITCYKPNLTVWYPDFRRRRR